MNVGDMPRSSSLTLPIRQGARVCFSSPVILVALDTDNGIHLARLQHLNGHLSEDKQHKAVQHRQLCGLTDSSCTRQSAGKRLPWRDCLLSQVTLTGSTHRKHSVACWTRSCIWRLLLDS